METQTHKQLKAAAVEYLLSRGCAAVATEVACPISRYRIDVAGYLDDLSAADDGVLDPEKELPERPVARAGGRGVPRQPAVIFIECKATRADFFRDRRATPQLVAERERLLTQLREVEEEVVKVNEPHLRRSGGFLFPELESWDLGASRSPAYRAVLRALRRVDRQLYSQTKFFMVARYQLASRLFVLAPPGIIEPAEAPIGWGLLELARVGSDGQPPIRLVRTPCCYRPPGARLARGVRNIAAAATRMAFRSPGPTSEHEEHIDADNRQASRASRGA